MRPSTDRMNGMQCRLPCGCYSTDTNCDCEDVAALDPWLVAGGDVDHQRLAETRSYRQSKFRKV